MNISKKIIGITLASALLFSCENKEIVKNNPIVDSDVVLTNLSQYELPYVLKTSKKDDEINPFNITHQEGDMEWQITKGKGFDIVVEDWGDEAIDAEKEIKAQEDVEQTFEIKYQEQSPTLVKYSESIPGDEKNTTYHFYIVKEFGEGYYYTFRSNPTEKFTQEEVDNMINVVNTLAVAKDETAPIL